MTVQDRLEHEHQPTPSRERKAMLVGATVSILTFAAYMVGAGRSFGHGAAVTMDLFVDGPPSWPFTRQVAYNNHPLFSFVENLAADLTGSTDEVAMRVLPALFGALAAGLLTWRISARLSTLAGLTAGVVLAAHPMLAEEARDVRGYSLALLAIVLAGIAVFDIERPVLFGLAVFIAVGTHLYAAVPLVAMVAWRAGKGQFGEPWRVASGLGLLGGSSVYIGTANQMASLGRQFRPWYPLDAGTALLGGTAMSVCCLAVVVVVGVRKMRADRAGILAGLVMVGGVLGPWLLAPVHLYDRFVYWALPVLAVAVAWTVHRTPALVPLVPIAMASAIAPLVPHWTQDPMPNRALAEVVKPDTCAGSWRQEAVDFYAELRDFGPCPTIALLGADGTPLETANAREHWPVVCWAEDGAELRGRTAADC